MASPNISDYFNFQQEGSGDNQPYVEQYLIPKFDMQVRSYNERVAETEWVPVGKDSKLNLASKRYDLICTFYHAPIHIFLISREQNGGFSIAYITSTDEIQTIDDIDRDYPAKYQENTVYISDSEIVEPIESRNLDTLIANIQSELKLPPILPIGTKDYEPISAHQEIDYYHLQINRLINDRETYIDVFLAAHRAALERCQNKRIEWLEEGPEVNLSQELGLFLIETVVGAGVGRAMKMALGRGIKARKASKIKRIESWIGIEKIHYMRSDEKAIELLESKLKDLNKSPQGFRRFLSDAIKVGTDKIADKSGTAVKEGGKAISYKHNLGHFGEELMPKFINELVGIEPVFKKKERELRVYVSNFISKAKRDSYESSEKHKYNLKILKQLIVLLESEQPFDDEFTYDHLANFSMALSYQVERYIWAMIFVPKEVLEQIAVDYEYSLTPGTEVKVKKILGADDSLRILDYLAFVFEVESPVPKIEHGQVGFFDTHLPRGLVIDHAKKEILWGKLKESREEYTKKLSKENIGLSIGVPKIKPSLIDFDMNQDEVDAGQLNNGQTTGNNSEPPTEH